MPRRQLLAASGLRKTLPALGSLLLQYLELELWFLFLKMHQFLELRKTAERHKAPLLVALSVQRAKGRS